MSTAARGDKATAVVVFAKQPRPGQVKTRMCPPLRPAQAADLYACMLDDVLEATARCCAARGFALITAVHPPQAAAELAARAPAATCVVAQRGADLAARMCFAIAECAAAGFERIVLRGSDSPALDPALLVRAAEALADCDVTLSADVDGGYNVLAVRRPHRGLLDHAMSTGSVAEDTLANARRLGLRAGSLARSFDLDTAADLARLGRLRSGSAEAVCATDDDVICNTVSCRRTLAWLDREGAWPPA